MLTYVVHDEPLALPKDEAGGVRVELDGQVWRGRVQLLGPAAPQVLAQDVGHDLVAIVDGQDVAVAQVQAGGTERRAQGHTKAGGGSSE